MSIHLEEKDLSNTQQMEVAVNGPDGATHLILCTGIATLRPGSHETFTFLVGPALSRRQFVSVIAWGAFSRVPTCNTGQVKLTPKRHTEACLLSIVGEYDDASGQVQVQTDLAPGSSGTEFAISYHVSILAELTFP